jgi:divalent metal cation (Fe/Co/Zn/Cd) transporter
VIGRRVIGWRGRVCQMKGERMIPALSVMVGSYIVFRCIETIVKEESGALQGTALVVGVITLACVFQIIRLSMKVGGTLNSLGF